MNGGYSFYSLDTGEVVTRRNRMVQVPADGISRLKEMSNDVNSNIDGIFDQDEDEIECNHQEDIIDRMVEDNNEDEDELAQIDEEERPPNEQDEPERTSNQESNKEEKINS